MPTVIRRIATRIDQLGYISHDHRPASWGEADALAGRRLDRRRSYAIIPNDKGRAEVCEAVQWTQACSGCTETPEMTAPPSRGSGCRECGYRGKVRSSAWVPISAEPACAT